MIVKDSLHLRGLVPKVEDDLAWTEEAAKALDESLITCERGERVLDVIQEDELRHRVACLGADRLDHIAHRWIVFEAIVLAETWQQPAQPLVILPAACRQLRRVRQHTNAVPVDTVAVVHRL